MRNCVTHHYACDCREEKFKNIQDENEKLKAKLAKLKRLILLMDDGVGDIVMNDLTTRQWIEFIKCFPDEDTSRGEYEGDETERENN